MAPPHLRETLRRLPHGPGIYIMRSRTGEVIYVGKATSLRDRVRSYFAPGAGEAVPKVRRIAAEAHRIDVQETGSELAALLLESRLIKRFGPRYNSQGRGYRSLVFIKVEATDPFPRVLATRRPVADGAIYLGPFASSGIVQGALDLVHRLFPLRTCDEPIGLFRDRRPCIRGQIGRCGAPCAGLADAGAYGAAVDEALRFLRGEPTGLVERLEAEMAAAAKRLEFERAVRLRDDLAAARSIVEQQALLAEALARRSVVALCRDRNEGTAELFVIHRGLLAGEERVPLGGRGPIELIPELLRLLARVLPPGSEREWAPRSGARPQADARAEPPVGGVPPTDPPASARAFGPGLLRSPHCRSGTSETAAMSREDLDELLIVTRWLRRLPRANVVELPVERLADPGARQGVAGKIAARLCNGGATRPRARAAPARRARRPA
jgi:hypothetical protein